MSETTTSTSTPTTPLAAAASLVPSQVTRSSNTTNNNNNRRKNNNNRNNRQRRTNNNNNNTNDDQKKKKNASNSNSSTTNIKKKQQTRNQNDTKKDNNDTTITTTTIQKNKKKKNNNNTKKKKPNEQEEQSKDNTTTTRTKTNGGKRKKKKKKKKKYHPWKSFLPEGSVDPITLEPLNSLSYPPFALCADAPYTVVPEWPIIVKQPTTKKKETTSTTFEEEEERQKKVLESQWGTAVVVDVNNNKDEDDEETKQSHNTIPLEERKFNLYDGRALAYYMVSQLQFIDPLNRRDLTRDEIVNLDEYLQRHHTTSTTTSTLTNNNVNVTQAYDDKGVTVSSASAMASTQAGQLELRQQTAQALAQSLLQSLFATTTGSSSVGVSNNTTTTTTTTTNALQQQYAATQRREEEQARRRRRRQQQQNQRQNQQYDDDDIGIYGDDGFMIIDDDANPGLRGTSRRQQQQQQQQPNHHMTAEAPAFTPGSLWSASHITNRYISHGASQHASNFPALQQQQSSRTNNNNNNTTTRKQPLSQQNKPSSSSLARITKVITKTDPKQIQKQREARELFVKRAAMSNLSFGSSLDDPNTTMNAATIVGPTGLLSVPTNNHAAVVTVTEGQLTRNQALASALGVVPATIRQQQQASSYNQGWARPVNNNNNKDEFDTELSTANVLVASYPDTLLEMARIKGLAFILKLERKWKTWLQDDTAASLPLSKMDRPTRTLVHHYSDYWNLHTESFDPEPNRYIHCVKLPTTAAPHPLVSVVLRQYPMSGSSTSGGGSSSSSSSLLQTAGQSPREFPPPPERKTLPLKPRSTTITTTQMNRLTTTTTTTTTTMESSLEPPEKKNIRSNELFLGRERPKLELAPRTLPTELPPLESKFLNLAKEREIYRLQRQAEQEKKEQEHEWKRQALESVFASSDDSSSSSSVQSHDSTEWEDLLPSALEPTYVSSSSDGSDEEEE